jgi:hypothetical protein
MMKKIPVCFLLFATVFSTGCPKYRPSVDFNNKSSLVNKVNDHLKAKQVEYIAALGNDPAKAKAIRNELIEDALPYIDSAYIDFITDLQAGRDRANFVADLVELGASGAVGIIKGRQRAIQIVGIALTAFKGGRRSADLNFYKEQTTPVLISKMDGNRAKVRAIILTREKGSVEDYPIGAAIADIIDYYNGGTLVRAFTELAKDTAVQTKASEDDVLVLKGVPLTRPATEEDTKDAQDALPVLANLSSSLSSADPAVKAAALKKLQTIVSVLEKDPAVAPLLKVAEIASTDTDGQKLLNGLKKVKRSQPTDSDIDRKVNRAINANGK